MDITPYVDSLRRDLIAAAEAGGPEVKAAAELLTLALDPSARLALMEAISQAAASITSDELIGMPVDEIERLDADWVIEQLGIEISPTRRKCALLSLKVMRGATTGDASWPE